MLVMALVSITAGMAKQLCRVGCYSSVFTLLCTNLLRAGLLLWISGYRQEVLQFGNTCAWIRLECAVKDHIQLVLSFLVEAMHE
mmetsp:Transcript_53681/g.151212  ORF Transcript_53681/g.151212 Transcript_53681/m.151212 type:complete len:84 (-) Transcript_53681:249-500(-)